MKAESKDLEKVKISLKRLFDEIKKMTLTHIETTLNGLGYDVEAYPEDNMIFDNHQIFWWASSEKEYTEIERALDALTIETEEFTISVGYDVSGFEYWMVLQEEHNYANINIQVNAIVKDPKVLIKAFEDIREKLNDIECDNPAFY